MQQWFQAELLSSESRYDLFAFMSLLKYACKNTYMYTYEVQSWLNHMHERLSLRPSFLSLGWAVATTPLFDFSNLWPILIDNGWL